MQHPDGVTVTQTRYLPFGGYRDGSGGNPITDRGYTGQQQNDDLGLIYMNARYYVPYINRFLSADTIVPDPANPQTLNRYSYTLNNPVNLTDPTGHYSCNISFDRFGICVDVILSYEQQYHVEDMYGQAKAIGLVPTYPDNSFGGWDCTDTLVNCFRSGKISVFEDYEQIDQQEFDSLLNAVAEDLYTHDIPNNLPEQWIAGRDRYDTPFYNGGGRGGDEASAYDSNQQICLEQGCFGRSEINYFAQGMWAAAGDFTLDEALRQTKAWSYSSYLSETFNNGIPEGKLYWTEYGYNWYIDWLEDRVPPVVE